MQRFRERNEKAHERLQSRLQLATDLILHGKKEPADINMTLIADLSPVTIAQRSMLRLRLSSVRGTFKNMTHFFK